MKERIAVIGFWGVMLLAFAVVMHTFAFFLTLMIWPVGEYQCYVETSSFEHRYLMLPAKCQVLVNGKWVDWESHREMINVRMVDGGGA